MGALGLAGGGGGTPARGGGGGAARAAPALTPADFETGIAEVLGYERPAGAAGLVSVLG